MPHCMNQEHVEATLCVVYLDAVYWLGRAVFSFCRYLICLKKLGDRYSGMCSIFADVSACVGPGRRRVCQFECML